MYVKENDNDNISLKSLINLGLIDDDDQGGV